MAINHLLIGRACFIVRAGSLPNGYNQRPGMTLLLADGESLELEIDGQSVAAADAWLLAPEIRRRFVHPQPHVSITIEPSHPAYARLLRWARVSPGAAHRFEVADDDRTRLTDVATQQAFDAWLDGLLSRNQQRSTDANQRLEHLLALVQNAGIEDQCGADLAGLSPALPNYPGPLFALAAGQHWHSTAQAAALAETAPGAGSAEQRPWRDRGGPCCRLR